MKRLWFELAWLLYRITALVRRSLHSPGRSTASLVTLASGAIYRRLADGSLRLLRPSLTANRAKRMVRQQRYSRTSEVT